MQVGDLVRHTGWQENGLIVKELRRYRATHGGVYEIKVFGRHNHSQWCGRDMEVISEHKKNN